MGHKNSTHQFFKKPAASQSLYFFVPHTKTEQQTGCGFFLLCFSALLFFCLVSDAAQPCLLEALPVGPAGGQRLNGITRFASLQAAVGLARMVGEHIPVVVDCQGKIGIFVKIYLN